jgi:hypothetical protein
VLDHCWTGGFDLLREMFEGFPKFRPAFQLIPVSPLVPQAARLPVCVTVRQCVAQISAE